MLKPIIISNKLTTCKLLTLYKYLQTLRNTIYNTGTRDSVLKSLKLFQLNQRGNKQKVLLKIPLRLYGKNFSLSLSLSIYLCLSLYISLFFFFAFPFQFISLFQSISLCLVLPLSYISTINLSQYLYFPASKL